LEIQPQQPLVAQNVAGESQTEISSNALSSDFETFLKMLTTQLENQDPLNPVESSEFAMQLATFSGVEQQIRTNDLLADMVGGLGASGLSQLASWVGMEARVSTSAAFNGAPITLAPEADPASDAAYLVVRDATGAQVSREGIPLNVQTIEWAGMTDTGAPLPAGNYTFEVESQNQGQVTSTRAVDHYALVHEARLSDGGIELILSGGNAVPSGDVRALRTPLAAL
jgi:flagellar basal-body rod modification protein FlgD